MATSRSADRSPAQQPARGAVDALIAQIRRVRGSLEAVRRETAAASTDVGEARLRWQRALCDLAARELDSLAVQFGQLREGQPGGERDGSGREGQEELGERGERERSGAGGEVRDPLPGAQRHGRPPGRAGSAEWHLLTDETDWSDELFAIFGRTPDEGPLSLDDLPSCFDPADQPRLTAMMTDCLVDGKPMEGEFRARRPDGSVRTLHIVGEPVLDAHGATASMWAVLRDVSDLRTSRHAVLETRAELMRQRHIAHTEHRLAVELHEAVLPPWRGPLRLPPGEPGALALAAHYFPATAGALIGGDWYDALRLPESRTLLSVGDLAGHGVQAASGMAMLLGALRGMALTGAAPGPLLGRLNALLETAAHPALVSAACCLYDPAERTLVWSQAGHPAPLLFRDGAGRALTPPEGLLLGASQDAEYAQAEERLHPGDLLLLHTDGLCPQDAGPAERRLLDLAPRFAAADGVQDCMRAVVEEFGGGHRADDACVLIARVPG